jgi:hypothetical protein
VLLWPFGVRLKGLMETLLRGIKHPLFSSLNKQLMFSPQPLLAIPATINRKSTDGELRLLHNFNAFTFQICGRPRYIAPAVSSRS